MLDAAPDEPHRWVQVASSTSNVPCPRAGHVAVSYGASLLVFGGMNEQGYCDDFWLLQLDDFGEYFVHSMDGDEHMDRTFRMSCLGEGSIPCFCSLPTLLTDPNCVGISDPQCRLRVWHLAGTKFSKPKA